MLDGNLSSLLFERFESLPLMLMSVSVLSKFRPGGPIEGVSDAEPAGETPEGLGGIQASALAEPDAS